MWALCVGVNHAQFAENSPHNVVRGDIASQLPDAEATARIAEVPRCILQSLVHCAYLLRSTCMLTFGAALLSSLAHA